ncbi:MAG: hypothetical protein ACRESZ_20190 [Methylococcales bacterium]
MKIATLSVSSIAKTSRKLIAAIRGEPASFDAWLKASPLTEPMAVVELMIGEVETSGCVALVRWAEQVECRFRLK